MTLETSHYPRFFLYLHNTSYFSSHKFIQKMEIFIMMQTDQSHTGIMTNIMKIYHAEPKIFLVNL